MNREEIREVLRAPREGENAVATPIYLFFIKVSFLCRFQFNTDYFHFMQIALTLCCHVIPKLTFQVVLKCFF